MRFTIKLTRITTETAEIEIDAADEDSANVRAGEIADGLNNALGGPTGNQVPEGIMWELEDSNVEVDEVNEDA